MTRWDETPRCLADLVVIDVVVVLVGSRIASAMGIETARALGLALGVDAAAHERAVEAGGLLLAYSGVASTLRILESVNGSELRFRALLTEGSHPRVQLHRA
jgi:hypothetical protein